MKKIGKRHTYPILGCCLILFMLQIDTPTPYTFIQAPASTSTSSHIAATARGTVSPIYKSLLSRPITLSWWDSIWNGLKTIGHLAQRAWDQIKILGGHIASVWESTNSLFKQFAEAIGLYKPTATQKARDDLAQLVHTVKDAARKADAAALGIKNDQVQAAQALMKKLQEAVVRGDKTQIDKAWKDLLATIDRAAQAKIIVEQQCSFAEGQKQELENKLQAVKDALVQDEKGFDQIRALYNEIETKLHESGYLINKDKLIELQNRLDKQRSDLADDQRSINTLQRAIKDLNSEINRGGDAATLAQKKQDLANKQQALDQKGKDIAAKKSAITRLEQETKPIKEALQSVDTEVNQAKKELDQARKELKKSQDAVEDAGHLYRDGNQAIIDARASIGTAAGTLATLNQLKDEAATIIKHGSIAAAKQMAADVEQAAQAAQAAADAAKQHAADAAVAVAQYTESIDQSKASAEAQQAKAAADTAEVAAQEARAAADAAATQAAAMQSHTTPEEASAAASAVVKEWERAETALQRALAASKAAEQHAQAASKALTACTDSGAENTSLPTTHTGQAPNIYITSKTIYGKGAVTLSVYLTKYAQAKEPIIIDLIPSLEHGNEGLASYKIQPNPVKILKGKNAATFTVTLKKQQKEDNKLIINGSAPGYSIKLGVVNIETHTLQIPKYLHLNSPNKWEITNIYQYPNNRVIIVDKDNIPIYDALNYDNENIAFDDHCYAGEEKTLPDGIYIYFIYIDKGRGLELHATGTLSLKR